MRQNLGILVEIFVSPTRRRTMYTDNAGNHSNTAGQSSSSLTSGNPLPPETQNYPLRKVVNEDIWVGEHEPTIFLVSFSKNPQVPRNSGYTQLQSSAKKSSVIQTLIVLRPFRTAVGGLLPGDHLKEAPVRTYFRIISGAIFLLKKLSWVQQPR